MRVIRQVLVSVSEPLLQRRLSKRVAEGGVDVIRCQVPRIVNFLKGAFDVHAVVTPRGRVHFNHGVQVAQVVRHGGGVHGHG